jgi:hypothetical protein
MRINRFTGHAQILVPNGWKNLERSRPRTTRAPRDLLESLEGGDSTGLYDQYLAKQKKKPADTGVKNGIPIH